MSAMCCSVLELASPFDMCLTRRYEGGVGPPTKANSVTAARRSAWLGGTTLLSDASHKIKFQMARLKPVATDTTRDLGRVAGSGETRLSSLARARRLDPCLAQAGSRR